MNKQVNWKAITIILAIALLGTLIVISARNSNETYDIDGLKLPVNFVDQVVHGMDKINSKAFIICNMPQDKCLQITRTR